MRQQQTNEQATKASARRRLIRTVGTKSDLTMRRRRIEEQALHRRSTGDASNRETRLHRRVPHHRTDTRRRPCVDLTLAHARQHATDENGRPARHSRPHSTPRRSANAGFRPCLPTPRQSTTHARPATCRGEPARKPRAGSALTPKKKRTADESASESHPVQGIEHFFWTFSNTRSMSRDANCGIQTGIPSPEISSECDWRALDFCRSKRQLLAKKTCFLSA